MDIRAAVPDDRPLLILPGKRALVPTGLILEIPNGMEGQVRPRSGLAFKHGITCLNTPGTIDSDYRGEVKVLLINLGHESFTLRRGDRIAQLVVQRVEQVVWREVDGELPDPKLPLILKGIATAEDAIMACDHGVEVVYVSNHSSTIDLFVLVALGLPNTRFFLSGFLQKLVPLGILAHLMGTFFTVPQDRPKERRRIFARACLNRSPNWSRWTRA